MQLRSMNQVIQRLDHVLERSRRESDKHGFYAALYRTTTLELGYGQDNGVFENPEWVERVALNFAARYFRALDRFESGNRASAAWHIAFQAGHDPDLIILQHMILGVHAHVGLDLGIAMSQVSPNPDDLLRARGDFNRIENILALAIANSRRRVAKVSPRFNTLQHIAGPACDKLARLGLRSARRTAWTLANSLTSTDWNRRRAIKTAHDRRTARLGLAMIHPVLKRALRPVRRHEEVNVSRVIDALLA